MPPVHYRSSALFLPDDQQWLAWPRLASSTTERRPALRPARMEGPTAPATSNTYQREHGEGDDVEHERRSQHRRPERTAEGVFVEAVLALVMRLWVSGERAPL